MLTVVFRRLHASYSRYADTFSKRSSTVTGGISQRRKYPIYFVFAVVIVADVSHWIAGRVR